MTVFSVRCWKNALAGWPRAVGMALCLLGLPGLGTGLARAESRIELTELQVVHTDGGLSLSARLHLDLPAEVQDALQKGIAIYFVAEADVVRERWYWSDRQVAATRRYMRVAWLPLTRRWRLNTAPAPILDSGLGVTLTQYYDTQAEMMDAVQRIARWPIARAADLDPGARQFVRFRFRLDASQLPRTFQIGVIGHPDWDLSIERRLDLTQESGP